jgi:hypothetical protein
MEKMLSALQKESEDIEEKTENDEKEKEKLMTYEQKHKSALD